MFFALLASIGSAGADTLAKITLDKRKFPVRKYLPILFFFLALITLIFVPSTYSFQAEKFFTFKYIALFALMIWVSIAWNLRFYKSIQCETLHEFELIILLTPIATVILAAIFYPDERNWGYFLAALLASGSLLISRLKKNHLVLTENMKRSLQAMFFISIEVILLKELLHIFSPALLYFVRTLVLFLIYFYLYRPKWYDYLADKKTSSLIIADAAFAVLYMVMKYYSFIELGIVKTTLILLLAPIFTYTASYFYFRERRLFKRDLAAAVIIIACVAYVTLIK